MGLVWRPPRTTSDSGQVPEEVEGWGRAWKCLALGGVRGQKDKKAFCGPHRLGESFVPVSWGRLGLNKNILLWLATKKLIGK